MQKLLHRMNYVLAPSQNELCKNYFTEWTMQNYYENTMINYENWVCETCMGTHNYACRN